MEEKTLIFGKYDLSEVTVNDGGLAKYIDLTPTNVPHSGGKHANRWFGKSKLSIDEDREIHRKEAQGLQGSI